MVALLIQLSSLLALLGVHVFVLMSGMRGKRRGLRTAAAYLFVFDWALIMGVSAGRSIADAETGFWSWYTVGWGVLGVLLLFLPAWLLFRHGLRFSGIFLLPVMPTERKRRSQAGRTLRSYVWGTNYPFYREEDGELEKAVDGSIMLREGGPGLVITKSHYAIPITTGTRDVQVGGGGLVFTGRKERPRSLVDLRLQTRAKLVHALTRDGIMVKMMMFAIFQIDRRGARGEGLYPFNPQAVFRAIHAQGVGPEQEDGEREEIGWGQVVAERAANMLRDAIAQKLLDQLLEGDDEDEEPPRERLRKRVAQELAQAMQSHGIQVMAVGLGNIEVEDEEVLKQRVASWTAHWERRRLAKEAQGRAEAIRLLEEARADTQRQMVEAITEAFQQLADTRTPIPIHVIALRFIDALEDMATSPVMQQWLPQAVQSMPARLRLSMEHPSAADEESVSS